MTIEQTILSTVQDLPVDKKLEVLNFAASLKRQNGPRKPFKSLLGALARSGFSITEEDIAEARREMWGNFPRDIE